MENIVDYKVYSGKYGSPAAVACWGGLALGCALTYYFTRPRGY